MSLRLHTQRAVLVAWCAAFGCGLLTAAKAQTTRYQVIKYLDGMGPTALIEGKEGSLYGTLETAGRKGKELYSNSRGMAAVTPSCTILPAAEMVETGVTRRAW